MVLDVSSDDVLENPLYKVLLLIAAPIAVQNVARIVEQVVDLFWIGQYSTEAVAAVGVGLPVLSLPFTGVISTPIIGTQILVSQHVGSDDADEARAAASAGVVLAAVLAVLFGVVLEYGIVAVFWSGTIAAILASVGIAGYYHRFTITRDLATLG